MAHFGPKNGQKKPKLGVSIGNGVEMRNNMWVCEKIQHNVPKIRKNVQKSIKCAIEPKSRNGAFWAQK